MTPTQPCTATRHGTRSAYNHHHCRCPEATEASRHYSTQRRRAQGIPQRTYGQHHTRPRRPGPHRDDVDPIAVERAITGTPPTHLTVAERSLAIAHLTRRGLSARAIGQRIGVSQRTVVRYRTGKVANAAPQLEQAAA